VKYLITGGSGYCGTEIGHYLLQKGADVRILDLEPPSGLPSEIEFMEGDIRDRKVVERACQGIDKVIHAAAKVPISKAGKAFYDVNVSGTRNILEASFKSRVNKVVYLSSSSVQFGNPSPVDEDAPYGTIAAYSKSKVEAEHVCKEYVRRGLPVDIIRPRTVVGIGRLGLFDILFDWIAEGRKIYIIGDGHNKIQFLHVQDLASCCFLSSRAAGSNIFNIGSKTFATLKEDLQALIDSAQTKSKVVCLPVKLTIECLRALDFLRLSPLAPWHYQTYHQDFYFTNERAKKNLSWQPQYGNAETLKMAYFDYLRARKQGQLTRFGTTHRKRLKQKVLNLLKLIS